MMPEGFIFLSLCLTSELCYSKHTLNVPLSIIFFKVLFDNIGWFYSTAVVVLFYTYHAFALVACEKFWSYKMATFYKNSQTDKNCCVFLKWSMRMPQILKSATISWSQKSKIFYVNKKLLGSGCLSVLSILSFHGTTYNASSVLMVINTLYCQL